MRVILLNMNRLYHFSVQSSQMASHFLQKKIQIFSVPSRLYTFWSPLSPIFYFSLLFLLICLTWILTGFWAIPKIPQMHSDHIAFVLLELCLKFLMFHTISKCTIFTWDIDVQAILRHWKSYQQWIHIPREQHELSCTV